MDTSTIALFWIGVGTVLTGIGVIWWVSILAQEKKNAQEKKE